jgi:hypothetical protein
MKKTHLFGSTIVLGAKSHQNVKNKREYTVTVYQFSEKYQNLRFKKNKFESHLDSDFRLVAFSKLVFSVCRQFLKTCHLLGMLANDAPSEN